MKTTVQVRNKLGRMEAVEVIDLEETIKLARQVVAEGGGTLFAHELVKWANTLDGVPKWEEFTEWFKSIGGTVIPEHNGINEN